MALVAAGSGMVLAPLPAAAEPEQPTTSQRAAELVAARAHDLEVTTEQFNTAREQLLAAQKAAAVAADRVTAAEADLAEARDRVRAVARGAWTGDRLGALQALLTSRSAADLLDRVGTLQTIADHDNGVLGGAQRATDVADQARTTADQLAAGAQAQVDRVTAQKKDLDAQIAVYQAQYDRLHQRGASRLACSGPETRPAAGRSGQAAGRSGRAAGGPAPGQRTGVPPRPAAPPPAATASASVSGGGSAAARTAVSTAMAQIGDPYVWGAAGPNAFDCSGLTQYAYAAAGISLPHSSSMQSTMGVAVSRADLRPGDLLFFYSPVSHVGMYIGNGQMVHASTAGVPVKVAGIDSMGSFTTARRIAG